MFITTAGDEYIEDLRTFSPISIYERKKIARLECQAKYSPQNTSS
jgi:hypothetical protein